MAKVGQFLVAIDNTWDVPEATERAGGLSHVPGAPGRA